jgi:uncharacterized protein
MANGDEPLAVRLEEDMKAALRAGDKLRLSVIRRARSTIKNAEIAARGGDAITEEAMEKSLRALVKQHKESIEHFDAGGRTDRADAERQEMAILEEYLPAQMDAVAIDAAVRSVVEELGATGPKEMGTVMKAAMARLGNAADGKEVSGAVKRVLEEKAAG